MLKSILKEMVESGEVISLRDWKDLTDTLCNDRLYHEVYDVFCHYINKHSLRFTVAEGVAFTQLGFKLQTRVFSYAKEHGLD